MSVTTAREHRPVGPVLLRYPEVVRLSTETATRGLCEVLAGLWGGPALATPTRPRWPGDSLLQPETLRQARTFETVKGRYVAAGLCHYCAALASYGHSHGWRVIEQPRHRACAEVVLTLPVARANGWRSLLMGSQPTQEGQERQPDVPGEPCQVESVTP